MAESGEAHILEPYLPLLDKRSYVHAMCSETVRQSKVLEAMNRDYKRGDLAKLKASVQHAKLDSALATHSLVLRMSEVLREAGAQSIICENMFRKVESENLRPSDVQTLESAVAKLESLGLGPELWKESNGPSTLYPKLPKVKGILPSQGNLKILSQEFRGGSSRYCTAWLRAVEECQLTPKLETLTAKWFDSFPDSPQKLREQLLEDDVRFSFDEVPWDDREKLIPEVRQQLEEFRISIDNLTLRTTRSFGPDGGTVVVVTGPSEDLDKIRQVSDTDCDRERAELLDIGNEYDRERARERAAQLTVGELTMEEPMERSYKQIPKPKDFDEEATLKKSVPAMSPSETGLPPPPPPASHQKRDFDEGATFKKSAPPVLELDTAPPPPPAPRAKPEAAADEAIEVAKSAPPKAHAPSPRNFKDLRMPIETAAQKNARIEKIMSQAGLSDANPP